MKLWNVSIAAHLDRAPEWACCSPGTSPKPCQWDNVCWARLAGGFINVLHKSLSGHWAIPTEKPYIFASDWNKQINKPAKQNTIYLPLSHFSNEHHEWVSSFALSLVGVKHCNLSKAAKPIVLPPCLSLSGVFCSNSLHSSLDLTANK